MRALAFTSITLYEESADEPGTYDPLPTAVSSTDLIPGALRLCCATARVTHFSLYLVGVEDLGFTGFLPPVGGEGGSFSEPVRTFKLGQTVPVKMRLDAGGAPVKTGTHTLELVPYANEATPGDPTPARPTGPATGGNRFRLTSAATGQWHFDLSTGAPGLRPGMWLLRARLSDGSEHSAFVHFRD